MDYSSYTTIFAIGSLEDITNFEKSLPIHLDSFDFNKIIPCPDNILAMSDTLGNMNSRNEFKKWSTTHWGTPSNGFIEETRKIFGANEMGYQIELRTAFNEPVPITNKIISSNKRLDFFIHHSDFSSQEYIGLKLKNNEQLFLLGESYLNENGDIDLKIHEDKFSTFIKYGTGYLQWKFLNNFKMGVQIIEYLKNI